ncbi:DUF6941 family protein [Agreia pratensis]|uniref:Uncharacterized protein n=1 Tax=Agreia pratensis TaxID=150121 RepID=A0A1X7K3N7_9MICO|nr:hypothetical protein [Agreia pratensis]SMG34786.1 hypothetical protein SAMN06296010_1988 [Agreia pratensis]
MIEVKALLLCDSANVREGLLGVLAGGITTINRPSYPAPLLADLALSFLISGVPENGESFHITVEGHHEDEASEALFGAEVDLDVGYVAEARLNTVPLVLSLANAGVPKAGIYTIVVSANNEVIGSLPFDARIDPALPSPSI